MKKKVITIGKHKLLLTAAICVLALLVMVVAIGIYFSDRIVPGVAVAGTTIGGMTTEQGIAQIQKKIEETPHVIRLINGEKEWNWQWSQLGVEVDAAKTVDEAMSIGRKGKWSERMANIKDALFVSRQLSTEWSWKNDLIVNQVASLAAQIDDQPEEPSVTMENESIVVYPGKDGVVLNSAVLITQIKQRLDNLKTNEAVAVPLISKRTKLSETETEELRQRIESLSDYEISLTLPGSSDGADTERAWTLNKTDLMAFFGGSKKTSWINKTQIAGYAATLAEAIDRDPENATFMFTPEASDSGKVNVFKPAKDGLKLNQEATILLLADTLDDYPPGENKKIKLTLPVDRKEPLITTGSVNSLGIKELIGRGISYFNGSIPGRIHNIELASLKINGVLIAPGEVFSFNNLVGDISAATGYQQAYIIKDGRTVLGDGGGVCQVSTTLFRAALNAGLPIEERHAHAYRVHYYEDHSQVGIDATVFSPTADFKFRNDTLGYILVQTNMDKQNKKLTFDFYGTSDGRKAVISKSRIWDQTPPPPDLYQDDPTLTTGTVKQIDFSAWGAKTAFDWTVTRGTETLQQKTFYSTYRPWQAVYLKGTKP